MASLVQLIFVLFIFLNTAKSQDKVAEYIANHVDIEYKVLDNVNRDGGQFTGQITLTNTGNTNVTSWAWQIYFCSVRLMETQILKNFSLADQGAELGYSQVKVYHINGCLHKLQPMDNFTGIPAKKPLVLPFKASDWVVQKTDIMPHWFVKSTMEDDAMIISSTSGESLDFVEDFTKKEQWKRSINDKIDPFQPQERYNENQMKSGSHPMLDVIPTPKSVELMDNMYVNIMTGDWVVVFTDDSIKPEAGYLAGKLSMETKSFSKNTQTSRYILLTTGDIENQPEGYEINIMAPENIINITGSNRSGIFYGIQTLLSLNADQNGVKACRIIDYPRFPYRGMHLDTSRNFFDHDDVMKLLDVMAMYKLNKFHFHLTDDEGWRLEIPDIQEATQVGGYRCFDLNETNCIIPQLGSGPSKSTSGSGYYTVAQYKEILQYAADRHIEVIPEFDMPGHSHAIIKAMEARYQMTGSDDFLLSDPADTSKYHSIQYFKDNAINPCMNSTYTFIRHLIREVKKLHQDIQPLTTFNFGGDEVAHDGADSGPWKNSQICRDLFPHLNDSNKRVELQKYFAFKLAQIVKEEGLDLAGWEDGLGDGLQPFNRSLFPSDNVYMYAWNSVWEWGGGERAYVFANNDYKVILGHATHLYFDHPQEPDPEERGFYWATRYTDTYKTYSFDAEDVYNNIGDTLMGKGRSRRGYCDEEEGKVGQRCILLEDGKRDNIVGIQGHLWSETVRTSDQLHGMVFPRLLALAERAWHKADWEGPNLDSTVTSQAEDWAAFARTLGEKELARLDGMGVKYYIPPPGASFTGSGQLQANAMFPGLTIQYSVDGGNTWSDHKQNNEVAPNTKVYLRTRSASGSRYSRSVMVESEKEISAASTVTYMWTLLIFSVCLLI